MSRSLPTRALRQHPDLDQLKRQAKELLAAFRNGQPEAVAEVQAHYHGADASAFGLHDAQLVIARAYGFDSWPKLKAFVDGATVTRLGEAVRAGDLATSRVMLAARPELVHMDMSEHDEHRALHYAVLNRDPQMVRLLMEHGADPYKGIWPHRDATGALTIAADRGYDEIVAIINDAQQRRSREQAARQTTPVAPHIDRSSPLVARFWAAATPNDEAAVIACFEEDPRLVHWHQGDGWTPLHQASLMLYLDVARWLLAHGADVNASEPCHWTPLELVGVYRKTYTPEKAAAMVELLTAHGARMTGGAAVMLGDAAWLRARHAEGALTDPPGDYGLVTRAVIRNRPDMVALLLDLGFDPDERRRLEGLEEVVYSWGEPLRQCVNADRIEIAEILLQRGADPNPSIYAGTSPMFEAYQHDKRDMIALLERHGGVADAGIVGHFGRLEQARQMLADDAAGRLQPRGIGEGGSVAAALLVSGADGGQPDIVRLALDHLDWAPGDERWHWNLMRPLGAHDEGDRDRYLTCFRLMVERAGANAPAPYGRSILHDVCGGWPRETSTAEERVALATILLDAGARLDRRDDLLASTPLGWACRWGRLELVDLFLARGADPGEPDAKPWATPRAWAARMGRSGILSRLDAATSYRHDRHEDD
jgi:ankyrin repeat protein